MPDSLAQAETTDSVDRFSDDQFHTQDFHIIKPSIIESTQLLSVDPGWSFEWSDGLQYHFEQVFPFIDISAIPPFKGLPELTITGRVGTSFMFDIGHGDDVSRDDSHLSSKLRRGRIFTAGTYQGFFTYTYKVQFAIEGSRIFFNDFYIRHPIGDGSRAIQVGYMDPPVSLQAQSAIGDYGLMELPASVSALAPGLRFGVQADGTLSTARVIWALNASTVGQNQQVEGEDTAEAPLRLSARIVMLPVLESSADSDEVLHVGGSLSHQIAEDDSFRVRARPESFLFPFTVDTGELSYKSSQTMGLELLHKNHSLTQQAEFLITTVEQDSDERAAFYGWYYELSYALGKSYRRYDSRRGVLRGVESMEGIERPYAGVVELCARYSFLNLQRDIDDAGTQRLMSAGVNWFITKSTALRAEYVFAVINASELHGTDSILQGRIQFQY